MDYQGLVQYTEEPLLRGHPSERPLCLERLLDNVNLNTFLMKKG